ncbi:MAG: hypothetical protein IJC04_11280 [Oscillospiraceae bacterium]|nr:hypothetical protein [Oscillospiraceae bacterium]
MGLLDKLMGKKKPTLEDDIHSACAWIVTALNTSGYNADYTLESMKEIDRFFDEQSGAGGIITPERRGNIIFSIAAYIGETVIKLYGGKWITDDNDPMGEVNIAVQLDNGTIIFPAQRAMKRYQNGNEDSIYAYVYVLSQS